MRAAGVSSTWEDELYRCDTECCARPTGVHMVASPEISRNAQPGKVKAAPNAMGKAKKRGQGQYKGRSPADPTSGWLLLVRTCSCQGFQDIEALTPRFERKVLRNVLYAHGR